MLDLNQLPEKERQHMIKVIEETQAKQFMNLYTRIVTKCFDDCAKDFTSDRLTSGETDCVKKCTAKYLKLTNKVGQQMAEMQMLPGNTP